MQDEIESDRCDHGILFEYECDMCEKENKEFFGELLTMLGGGDAEKGKKWLIQALKETKPRDDRTRASESK